MQYAFFNTAFAKKPLLWVVIGLFVLAACEERPMTFRERPRWPDRDDWGIGQGDREHSDHPGSGDAHGSPGARSLEVSFASHDIEQAAVDFALHNEFVEQGLTLQRQYTSQNETFAQTVRPRVEERFEQGYADYAESEAFDQNGDRLLDILVVVDNSGSMKEEQKNLSTKIMPLLSSVTQTDWRIAVVTTDPADTCLRGLITKGDANASDKFSKAVQAGTSGSGNERGVLVAERAINGKCTLNKDWLRPHSTLAVLIVSDEDNCSNGADCAGSDYADASYLINAMARGRVLGSTARAYGLIHHPSQSRSECSTAENSAPIYAQVIDATQGTWGSICDDDYSATLNAISKDIAVTLGKKFALRRQPKAASVEVKVNGAVVHDYKVVANVIEFNTAPAEGAHIEVNYLVPGQTVRQEFALKEAPAAWDAVVSVDGQVLSPSDYVIDPAKKLLRFNHVPADRAEVVISYIRDLPLNKQFKLQSAYKAGSLTATINGQVTRDFTANETTGMVEFFTAPHDGAKIAFAYLKAGKPILTYPFSIPAGVENTLEVVDAQTQEDIAVTYRAGTLQVDAAEFTEGRILVVRYMNPRRDQFTVELPQDPISDSVELRDTYQVCRDELVVNGRTVDASACGFRADISAVAAYYDYIAASHQSFTLRLDGWDAKRPGQWVVLLDGVVYTDWQRQDQTIYFNNPLPIGSRITIRVNY